MDVDILTETESSVTRTPDGWIVRFYAQGPATQYEDGTHGDPGLSRVHYFVSSEEIRKVDQFDGNPEPSEQGPAAHCPPE